MAVEKEVEASGFNTESNIKVAKLLIFDRDISKVLDFLIIYKLYIGIRIRNILVEKQI